MPKMLNDEAVEYEDGTPATEAQVSFPLPKKVTADHKVLSDLTFPRVNYII